MNANGYTLLVLLAATGLGACSLDMFANVEAGQDGPSLIWKQTYDASTEFYSWTYAVHGVPADAVDSVSFTRRLADDPFGSGAKLFSLRGANPESSSRWIALTLRVLNLGKERRVDLDVELDYGSRDSTSASALPPALYIATGTADVVQGETRGGRRVLYRGDRTFDFAEASFLDELVPTDTFIRQRPAALIPARADDRGELFVSILVEIPPGSSVDAYIRQIVLEVFER